LAQICAEHGGKPFGQARPSDLRRLRDRMVETPEAANAWLKTLRHVYAWALSVGHVESNPAALVPYLRSNNPDGHHTWSRAEVETFEARWPAGTRQRLALALLLYTGVRRSDVVKLGRQMVRDGWLEWTETKGAARKPKHRSLPILPVLQAVIDATPSGHMTYIVAPGGHPYTPHGFGMWFRKACLVAGLALCTAHGLRKAGATIAAENGATEQQLMAIYGWSTGKEAARYTRQANRRKLAGDAMGLVVRKK
jgi:integrase